MAERFDSLSVRMDALTAERFGVTVTVNGVDYVAVESDFFAELGLLEGSGKSLVIFSRDYTPRRGDEVVLQGGKYTVTRIRRFNGKPQLTLEGSDGG